MSVVRGVFNNGLANVVQKIIRIADQLLLVPFFLTAWGAEYYGEWLTLCVVPSILAFSDLGFGSAVCNGFVLAYASGDKQKSANLYKSGFVIISASVLLGIILTCIVVVTCKMLGVFDKSVIPANEAMIAVTLMMASKLTTFYFQLAEAFYRSARKAATGSFLGSGNSLLNICVGLIILSLGYGVVTYALANLIISILYISLYWLIGRKMISLDGTKGHILKSDIKMIVGKGMGYLATPIWQSVYSQGTTFIVRIVLGAESVAVFNTVRTVSHSVNQMFSIINAAIFPDLQFEYGRGNIILVQRLFRIAVLVSIVIGLLGCSILSVYGLSMYNWWTQNTLTVIPAFWYLFVFGAFMNAIWWTSIVAYRVTNQPKHFAIVSVSMAFLVVGICYFSVSSLGIVGASLATALFETCMALIILPDACRLLQMKVTDLFCHIGEDYVFIKNKIIKKTT